MRALSPDEVIRVWEVGERQSPAERALTMLAAAYPSKSGEELRHLTLGRRNAQLLEVRRRLFGSELNAFAKCPGCGEPLEFGVPLDPIDNAGALPAADPVFAFETADYAVRFRLLDSTDLQAATAAADVDEARRLLAGRCVLDARHDNEVVAGASLPKPILEQLATLLANYDPQAETLIDLACPQCEYEWQAPFDIASFCYTEISALARRLLREVHALARAYAWHESDILAMSAQRRHYYLEQLI
jgi:hypothetical protein